MMLHCLAFLLLVLLVNVLQLSALRINPLSLNRGISSKAYSIASSQMRSALYSFSSLNVADNIAENLNTLSDQLVPDVVEKIGNVNALVETDVSVDPGALDNPLVGKRRAYINDLQRLH